MQRATETKVFNGKKYELYLWSKGTKYGSNIANFASGAKKHFKNVRVIACTDSRGDKGYALYVR